MEQHVTVGDSAVARAFVIDITGEVIWASGDRLRIFIKPNDLRSLGAAIQEALDG